MKKIEETDLMELWVHLEPEFASAISVPWGNNKIIHGKWETLKEWAKTINETHPKEK
jgi:hypothetical protein